jgi:hypothetical protein
LAAQACAVEESGGGNQHAVEHRRNARRQLAGIHDRALGEGGIVNDLTGGSLTVTASGASTQVNVAAGQALIQGSLYTNSASLSLDVAATGTAPSSAQTRIDLIVLRYDFASRQVNAVVKPGSPASAGAVEPALTRVANGVRETRLGLVVPNTIVPETSGISARRPLNGAGSWIVGKDGVRGCDNPCFGLPR